MAGELATRLGGDEAIREAAIAEMASQGSAEYLGQCDRDICAQVESMGIHLRQMGGGGGNKLRGGVVEEGVLLPPTIGTLTRMFPRNSLEYGGRENHLVVQYMAADAVDEGGKPLSVAMIIHTPLAGAGVVFAENKLGDGKSLEPFPLTEFDAGAPDVNFWLDQMTKNPEFFLRIGADYMVEETRRLVLNYTDSKQTSSSYVPSKSRQEYMAEGKPAPTAIPCACGSFMVVWMEADRDTFYRVNGKDVKAFPKSKAKKLYAYVPLWEADGRTKLLSTMRVGRLGNFAGDKLWGFRLAGEIDLEKVWFSPGGGETAWTKSLNGQERELLWPTGEIIGGPAAAWVGARELARMLGYPEPEEYRKPEYLRKVIKGGLNLPEPTDAELDAIEAYLERGTLASVSKGELVQKMHVPAINLVG